MLLVAGCGPVRLTATANIPTPLVVKVPIGVAMFVPTDFTEYVHKEERWGTTWNIELGKAQTEALKRLMSAMFERVVLVDNLNAGSQPGLDVQAILEPSIEEYAFVTPRDAGSPFYAVSIKYRVNVYSADGKLADSWGFTGYGTSPSEGISSAGPLAQATSLALRDAGAKLAVEFREQAVVRGLLPGGESVDTPPPTESTQTTELPSDPAPGSNLPPQESGGEEGTDEGAAEDDSAGSEVAPEQVEQTEPVEQTERPGSEPTPPAEPESDAAPEEQPAAEPVAFAVS